MLVSYLLFAHIAAGSVAVVAGTTALLAPKGATWHRAAGTLFVLTMVVAAAAGAGAALLKSQMITMLAGVFTCYLVATSWLTVARAAGSVADLAAFAFAIGVGAAGIALGLSVQQAVAAGANDPFGPEPYFFFGALALVAGAGDASVATRGGIRGAQRIARHLWRMTFALFIAVGSLFTGPGANAFPEEFRGSPLLEAPELIVLVLMFFWLGYTLLSRRFK